MKDLFVPYNIALLAKEKGFNEPCLAMYNHSNVVSNPSLNVVKNDWFFEIESDKDRCSAPLYQQLIEWFKSNYGITIFQIPLEGDDYNPVTWCYCAHDLKKSGEFSYEPLKVNLDESLSLAFKLI